MIKFIKTWTLPIAMILGIVGYFVLARIEVFAPAKFYIKEGVAYLTPLLIFAQLLLSFCKIEPKALIPTGWHGWLLLFQALMCCACATILLVCPMPDAYRGVLEGAMVCLICPTATAAVVITGKLGGGTSSLVTYTLLSNILAAIMVPLVFPLVEPHEGLNFLAAFLKILSKVFPLLLCPFFLSLFFRYFMKRTHNFLLRHSGAAFYIWAFALIIVTAQTTQILIHSNVAVWIEILIALGGLLACLVQFLVGKKVGARYNDTISAGQALGQKNTVLAIWIASSYLTPLAAVGPGSYVIWQNSFNSWQLWKKSKEKANN